MIVNKEVIDFPLASFHSQTSSYPERGTSLYSGIFYKFERAGVA